MSPTTACWKCKLQFAQVCLLEAHISEFHKSESKDVSLKFSEEEHGVIWEECINGLLEIISSKLWCESVQDLCAFANREIKFGKDAEPIFQEGDIAFIKLFNNVNNYSPDNCTFSFISPFVFHSLLHWKILAILISKTGDTENLVTFERRKCLQDKREVVITSVDFVDSHFHLDMFCKKSNMRSLPTLSWNLENTVCRIQYAVANYCYPRNWPNSTERSVIRKDDRLRLTFGIHPRLINKEKEKTVCSWLKQLEDLICASKVVAVGECGLSNSRGQSDS